MSDEATGKRVGRRNTLLSGAAFAAAGELAVPADAHHRHGLHGQRARWPGPPTAVNTKQSATFAEARSDRHAIPDIATGQPKPAVSTRPG